MLLDDAIYEGLPTPIIEHRQLNNIFFLTNAISVSFKLLKQIMSQILC